MSPEPKPPSYYCNYGCTFGRGCMGDPREDVLAYLSDKYGREFPDTVTDAELNEILVEYSDIDFVGPDHVYVERRKNPRT